MWAYDHRTEFQAARECCILQNHCRSEGNNNAIIPEKHCMKCACRNLRIISSNGGMLHCPHSIQKLQHGHRFEEELYAMHLRKPEYMIVRGLKAECCIVQIYCSHKPEHGIQSLWRSTT